MIEAEQHFIKECPLYKNIRRDFFDKIINICPNFRNMDTLSKFIWIFTNENEQIMKDLGTNIKESLILRYIYL